VAGIQEAGLDEFRLRIMITSVGMLMFVKSEAELLNISVLDVISKLSTGGCVVTAPREADDRVAVFLAEIATKNETPWQDAKPSSEGEKPMSTYGTVTDYKTGEPIRPATGAEWRRTADRIADIEPSKGDAYTGAWEDDDGRVVYVDGGSDAEVSATDVRALRDEAAQAGDLEQVRLCELATGDADDSPVTPRGWTRGNGQAFRECAKVILDFRMRVVEDSEEE
jgi:hypothetical protein